MAKGYRFLPDIAVADIAFKAVGGTYDELFRNAALAVFETMCDLRTIKKTMQRTVTLEAGSVENLLYDFLSEIVYIKDADGLLFSDAEVKVRCGKKRWSLKAVLCGEQINRNRHRLGNDVKAITMHMFRVRKEGKLLKAQVIIDI